MLLGHDMFGPNSGKTLNDKMELYFNDHEFSYLMVQENYLKSMPKRASGYAGREARLKTLELMDNAASSISDGDLADTLIHGNQQHWSLMPVHGMLSTVIPASNIYGSLTSQITFTSWLGNNSKHGASPPPPPISNLLTPHQANSCASSKKSKATSACAPLATATKSANPTSPTSLKP